MVMTKWYAGVDAGGTSTHVRLVRRQGGRAMFVGEGFAGPGNVYDVGADGLVNAVKLALKTAARQAEVPPSFHSGIDGRMGADDGFEGMTIGAAGVGRPNEVDEVTKAFSRAFPGVSIRVCNDAMVALAGGTFGGPGVVIIAGTGSAAWSYAPDGSWSKVGGWGYIIGDEGSGFAIGRSALASVAREADGRGPKTNLTEAVLEELGLDDPMEMVPIVHAAPFSKKNVAALAPVVLRVMEAGDKVAGEIVANAISQLAELVHAAITQSGLPKQFPLITVGGVFKNAVFYERFTREIEMLHMELKIGHPTLDPAAGACVLALKAQFNENDQKGVNLPLDDLWKQSLIQSYGV